MGDLAATLRTLRVLGQFQGTTPRYNAASGRSVTYHTCQRHALPRKRNMIQCMCSSKLKVVPSRRLTRRERNRMRLTNWGWGALAHQAEHLGQWVSDPAPYGAGIRQINRSLKDRDAKQGKTAMGP